MKQKFENIIFEYLQSTLPDNLKSMLVKGHSNDERPLPYICVEGGGFIEAFGDGLRYQRLLIRF